MNFLRQSWIVLLQDAVKKSLNVFLMWYSSYFTINLVKYSPTFNI